MRDSTKVRVGLIGLAAAIVAALALGTSSSAAAPAEEHCVIRVVGQSADGELRTTTPVCDTTRAAAMQKVALADGDFAIGVHFDGAGLTGSSVTVVGSSCIGGWLNLPPAWVNRISSTLHGCPRIKHFDGYDLVPPSQTTFSPGSDLTTLNNKTNSIQYLS